jgi:hypothetical protein
MEPPNLEVTNKANLPRPSRDIAFWLLGLFATIIIFFIGVFVNRVESELSRIQEYNVATSAKLAKTETLETSFDQRILRIEREKSIPH